MAKEHGPPGTRPQCGSALPAGQDKKKRLAEALRRNLAKRKTGKLPEPEPGGDPGAQ